MDNHLCYVVCLAISDKHLWNFQKNTQRTAYMPLGISNSLCLCMVIVKKSVCIFKCPGQSTSCETIIHVSVMFSVPSMLTNRSNAQNLSITLLMFHFRSGLERLRGTHGLAQPGHCQWQNSTVGSAHPSFTSQTYKRINFCIYLFCSNLRVSITVS